MWLLNIKATENPTQRTDCTAAEQMETQSCVAIGRGIYDFWESIASFPELWASIGLGDLPHAVEDKKKLETVYEFFCASHSLETAPSAPQVVEQLFKRLTSRWNEPSLTRSTISDETLELSEDIRRLSDAQLAAFEKLESADLTSKAFELFAAGALTVERMISEDSLSPLSLEESDTHRRIEPDGPSFFLWAEFALLASHMGYSPERWLAILPALLRCERIFALCYGEPVNGQIPAAKKYLEYQTRINAPDFRFSLMQPHEIAAIPQTGSLSLEESEIEATAVAKFAFPGEPWSNSK